MDEFDSMLVRMMCKAPDSDGAVAWSALYMLATCHGPTVRDAVCTELAAESALQHGSPIRWASFRHPVARHLGAHVHCTGIVPRKRRRS